MVLVSFALFGLFFTAPQYFQDVRGASPHRARACRLAGAVAGHRGSMIWDPPARVRLTPQSECVYILIVAFI
jgi:hypothetical protein